MSRRLGAPATATIAATAVGVVVVLACVAIGGARAEERQPGTLLLNMLTRDEEDNLARTLPKWAKIIDYWVIGVDEKTTDNSVAVIEEALAGIPGAVVITRNFDGIGPAWTELVEYGIEHFPQATHGILADADFAPLQDTLDKWQLDTRCSKHMFVIYTEDHRNKRNMDWIYRNIPGARVERRTHQTLHVPPLPDQEVFQTMIDLKVDERTGGFQDRTGKKNERYIGFLEADLVDYPNDTRTLYYLGFAHFDIFNANHDNPTAEHWDHLDKAVDYYKQRIAQPGGNAEERFFAVLKVAEIYDRFLKDEEQAIEYYTMAAELDGARADPWFYLGQLHRLKGRHKQALPFLKTAATLPVPERSLFMWLYLYECLSPLELGRTAAALAVDTSSPMSYADWSLVAAALQDSNCEGADEAEIKTLLARATAEKKKVSTPADQARLKALRKTLMVVSKNKVTIKTSLDAKLREELGAHLESILEATKGDLSRCRPFRVATTPYLRWFKTHADTLRQQILDVEFMDDWEASVLLLRNICR